LMREPTPACVLRARPAAPGPVGGGFRSSGRKREGGWERFFWLTTPN